MTITAPLVAIMILQRIERSLPEKTVRAVNHAKQKGASNWLSTLPLEEQGFTLTKNEFRDALALRYSKDIRALPSKCPCGQSFNVNHAMN